jgi:hypothetical protein
MIRKNFLIRKKLIAMSINDKMNIYLKDTIAEKKYFDIYAGLFFLTLRHYY